MPYGRVGMICQTYQYMGLWLWLSDFPGTSATNVAHFRKR